MPKMGWGVLIEDWGWLLQSSGRRHERGREALTSSTSLRVRRLAIEVPSPRLAQLAWIAGGTVLFLWLALDWRLHQDEPSYLYIGAFLPLDAILAGEFQPTGIEGHYLSRLLHVLLVHAIARVTGPGIFLP